MGFRLVAMSLLPIDRTTLVRTKKTPRTENVPYDPDKLIDFESTNDDRRLLHVQFTISLSIISAGVRFVGRRPRRARERRRIQRSDAGGEREREETNSELRQKRRLMSETELEELSS
jgi:hypothetical protein